jgi:hypothetical protein
MDERTTMKVKLILVSAYVEPVDDYTELTYHSVEKHSDYEEIRPEDLERLQKFVCDINRKTYRTRNSASKYYMIVYGPAEIKATEAIQLIVQEEERIIKAAADKKEKEALAAFQKKAQYSLKKKERLEKQLEKIKQQLGG